MFCAHIDHTDYIIRKHSIGFHLYADDTQLCIKSKMYEVNKLVSLIEQCINVVSVWMVGQSTKAELQQNGRTCVINTQQSSESQHQRDQNWRQVLTQSPTARNIGVVFDTEMSMVSHVKDVCCAPNYYLENTASIQSCLTQTKK